MIGSEFQNYLISVLLGYVVGSFPTAYIFVKLNSKTDIRQAGSRNIGARNAFEVSGSKIIGLIVLLIDVLKGTGAVLLSFLFFGNEFWIVAAGGIGAIMGHNFSPWMKFKGGRGLATTAGVMLLMGWIYIVIWLILYFAMQQFIKQVHLSSVVASVLSPIIILLIPEPLFTSVIFIPHRLSDVFWICMISSFIIIIRHIEPIKELIYPNTKIS